METPGRIGDQTQIRIDQDCQQLAASIKRYEKAHREELGDKPRPFRRHGVEKVTSARQKQHSTILTTCTKGSIHNRLVDDESRTTQKCTQRHEALQEKMAPAMLMNAAIVKSNTSNLPQRSDKVCAEARGTRPPIPDGAGKSHVEIRAAGRKTHADESSLAHLDGRDTSEKKSCTNQQRHLLQKRKAADEHTFADDSSSDSLQELMRARKRVRKAPIQALQEQHGLRRLPIDELITTTEKLRGPDDHFDILDRDTRELSQDPVHESDSSFSGSTIPWRGKHQTINVAQITARRAALALASFDLYFKPKYPNLRGGDEIFEYSAARCSDGYEGSEREHTGKVMPMGRSSRKLRPRKVTRHLHIRELPTCTSWVTEIENVPPWVGRHPKESSATARTSHSSHQQTTAADLSTTVPRVQEAPAEKMNQVATIVPNLTPTTTSASEDITGEDYMNDSQASYNSGSQASSNSSVLRGWSSPLVGSCTQAIVEDHIVSVREPNFTLDLKIGGQEVERSCDNDHNSDVSVNTFVRSYQNTHTTSIELPGQLSEQDRNSRTVYQAVFSSRSNESQDTHDDNWRPRHPTRSLIRMEVDDDIMASPLMPEPTSTLDENLVSKIPSSADRIMRVQYPALCHDRYGSISEAPGGSRKHQKASFAGRHRSYLRSRIEEIPETQEEVDLPQLPSANCPTVESSDPFVTRNDDLVLLEPKRKASCVKHELSHKILPVLSRNNSLFTPRTKLPYTSGIFAMETSTQKQMDRVKRPTRLHTTTTQKSLSDLTRQNSKRYGTIPSSEVRRARSYAPLLNLAPRFK